MKRCKCRRRMIGLVYNIVCGLEALLKLFIWLIFTVICGGALGSPRPSLIVGFHGTNYQPYSLYLWKMLVFRSTWWKAPVGPRLDQGTVEKVLFPPEWTRRYTFGLGRLVRTSGPSSRCKVVFLHRKMTFQVLRKCSILVNCSFWFFYYDVDRCSCTCTLEKYSLNPINWRSNPETIHRS